LRINWYLGNSNRLILNHGLSDSLICRWLLGLWTNRGIFIGFMNWLLDNYLWSLRLFNFRFLNSAFGKYCGGFYFLIIDSLLNSLMSYNFSHIFVHMYNTISHWLLFKCVHILTHSLIRNYRLIFCFMFNFFIIHVRHFNLIIIGVLYGLIVSYSFCNINLISNCGKLGVKILPIIRY